RRLLLHPPRPLPLHPPRPLPLPLERRLVARSEARTSTTNLFFFGILYFLRKKWVLRVFFPAFVLVCGVRDIILDQSIL
ncbi:60S ribosomal protein L19, putative, partial [Trypanosoma cruzi]